MVDVVWFATGSQLVAARSVPGVVSARPAVVVRDRSVRRSPHVGRHDRLHRAPVPAPPERPVPGRRVRQPSAESVLPVLADRVRPDALPAPGVRATDDGRPLLGHQFHGGRPHVSAQVNARARRSTTSRFANRIGFRFMVSLIVLHVSFK